jgi:hypothetical protein
MAEQSPFHLEDIPLEDARRMGRGPRMEPLLYDTLKQKIQSLADHAVQIRLGPEITQQRMRRYILRIARELNVPVTVRRVPGGLLFWRSSDEDRQQAQEAAKPLHPGQCARTTRSKARQRTGTRPGRGRRA